MPCAYVRTAILIEVYLRKVLISICLAYVTLTLFAHIDC